MSDKPEYTMDRTYKKLVKIHHVSEWLIDHWNHIPGPDEIFEKLTDGTYIPHDIRKDLAELLRQDLANAITPASPAAWRLLAKSEGIDISDEGQD